ncbi:Cell cycle exit and neuronal differentiation protein 1 [Varanus komodoensis]|uniref:Cell cycle exit and neuronal differentiation protein 1 n=1 Tax=Varanus komodoensis TaxID=61221 RepID=A0A8D2IW85_VARKO|nr:cell cycle exit and neuronal differentiation protein 1 [Varanus komodoensis]KAF7245471.1 Cell cycle exit and neuronal differentiation protein 1 [Varanus komodoensis]
MESKGSGRSGNKPEAKTTGSGKLEKPNSGPATAADKKDTPAKEQLPPAAATTPAKKAATAASEAAMLNDHSNIKPSPAAAATEGPEAAVPSADSEHKGNSAEESPGSSIFENMKPLLIIGGAAVAAIAVIVGMALLARKK